MAGTVTDDAENNQQTEQRSGPGRLHLGSKPGLEPCIPGDNRPSIFIPGLHGRAGLRGGRLMRLIALAVLVGMIAIIGAILMLGWIYEGPRRLVRLAAVKAY